MMLVKWTLYAMINAEELGITSKNIDEALKSKKPDVMRLVGTEGAYGEDLGLSKDWAARIIRHVGNYGEVYERNVGEGSKLKIPRGLNSLWSNGGIQYAPPIRSIGVIARSKATKQSIPPSRQHGLLRFARNDAEIHRQVGCHRPAGQVIHRPHPESLTEKRSE
jgi:hypothetical protein